MSLLHRTFLITALLALSFFGSCSNIPCEATSDFRLRSRAALASSIYETRFPNVTWDNDKWVLSTTYFDQGHYQSRMSSANGYLGINLAAVGPFFEFDIPVKGDNINGWPQFNRRQTFATVSGFFDEQPTTNGTNYLWIEAQGGETVISGVPHWSGIVVVLENGKYLDATVDPMEISNFSTSLDIRQSLSTWRYTWTPKDSDGLSFNIQYSMFTSKLFVSEGVVNLQIMPSQDCSVSFVNVLDGRAAVSTGFVGSGEDGDMIYTAVHPRGVSNVTAYIYAGMKATLDVDMSTTTVVSNQPYIGTNDSTIAQAAKANLKAGKMTTVTKFVGGASSDGFKDPRKQAKDSCSHAMSLGYAQSWISHTAEWRTVMPKASVDDYTYPENGTLPSDPNIIEAAIMAVVNPYYLLINTISDDALAITNGAPINTNSISVCGLGSDCYAGLVFWDAEIWMQPGLVIAFPWAAKQIANYRVATYGQALANAQTASATSRNATKLSSEAAVFPWTSGRRGQCTGTGPCFDYEYHINSDIVLEFINYWVASGDTEFFMRYLFPIMNSVAVLYSDLLTKNGTYYILTNMTDPDEYANNVDNGGFTMASISETFSRFNMFSELFDMGRNATYDEQAANILVQRDIGSDLSLEYTGMNGSVSVKQADVVLNSYPLNFQRNYSAVEMLRDLDYYAGRQSVNGPGMTFAIFSIVAQQVSPSGCSSYTYQQYSTQPYTRGPWFQFSEQLVDSYKNNGGTHPAFPFLTSHGGANQVTVFGYLGLRLTPDFVLHVDPSLPPQIPHLSYRTFYWHGWPIKAVANQTHTTLQRLSVPYKDGNLTFAHTPIPVQVGMSNPTLLQLPPNGTLTLVNRNSAMVKTVTGNVAQCLSVSSPDAFQPGQFPLAAIDGAVSTKWQPNHANIPQSMTVDLSNIPFQPITTMHFDWAQNPPTTITVVFSNSSATGAQGHTVISAATVTVSNPYMAATADIITPYTSNTTNITLNAPVWSGRYATLTIQGNHGDPHDNATGASVAEWAIIGTPG